ncbi:MAG: hypothetical protein ACI87E_000017 [Mariniblastus sp.]|jgi:hypothetical protein
MRILFASLAVIALLSGSSIAQQNQERQQQSNAQQPKRALATADHLQIAVQKVCPVSGGALGAMGEPIKVKVGEQIAYLCCKGCQGKELKAEHWKTIQANIAAAQGTCPIMGKPVSADMKSTVVNGQQVFVCCPPCIPKIQADIEGSLKKVNASYVSFVTAERQAKSDLLHAAAQGICPVSGGALGSMGAPVKVKVGEEEHAFLCCKACVGKPLNADHWKTIQTNLATAQKVCPVMGEPVDSSMKSTVVNGRKIFVCCPPCIEKIKADPAGYVAKLDAQISGAASGYEKGDGHDHSAINHAEHKQGK